MLDCLLLRIFVACDEGLILTSQKHNSLLILHLCLDVLFVEGINFLSLQIEVNADQVNELLN